MGVATRRVGLKCRRPLRNRLHKKEGIPVWAVLREIIGSTKWLAQGLRYATTPKRLWMNLACPTESLPSNLLT